MPIVGVNIINIAAKKSSDPTGPTRVNNSVNIGEIRERDLPIVNKKGLSVSFEYKADYVNEKNKQFAEIFIAGEVVFVDDNHEKILKTWRNDKKLPEDLNLQISNSVLRRCTTQALVLSEELQLPPPIPLPQASKKKEDESRYIG